MTHSQVEKAEGSGHPGGRGKMTEVDVGMNIQKKVKGEEGI